MSSRIQGTHLHNMLWLDPGPIHPNAGTHVPLQLTSSSDSAIR
jgi:hypothetical protein